MLVVNLLGRHDLHFFDRGKWYAEHFVSPLCTRWMGTCVFGGTMEVRKCEEVGTESASLFVSSGLYFFSSIVLSIYLFMVTFEYWSSSSHNTPFIKLMSRIHMQIPTTKKQHQEIILANLITSPYGQMQESYLTVELYSHCHHTNWPNDHHRHPFNDCSTVLHFATC